MPTSNSTQPALTYILPHKAGGVFTYIRNLLLHGSPGPFVRHAILTRNQWDKDELPADALPVDKEVHFHYGLPPENIYSVIKRLHRLLPPGPGVVVTNDWVELAMLSVYDPKKVVVNITHGDYHYYYDLAKKHEPVIDWFVAPSRHIAARLRDAMPRRCDSILYLPHGVTVPNVASNNSHGPVRALFVGRLVATKGVLELPEIDRRLRARNIAIDWTVVGSGPDEERVRELWAGNPSVHWKGNLPNQEVLQLYQAHDIFVLPTHSEGFPVTVLEAAAAGVVPVVSDLPSGIPEVVIQGSTGLRVKPGDPDAFASAIERLHQDRQLLQRMSVAARRQIAQHFDLTQNVKHYDALYEQIMMQPLSRTPRCGLQYGSRLDRSWIPNFLVRAVRSIRRHNYLG